MLRRDLTAIGQWRTKRSQLAKLGGENMNAKQIRGRFMARMGRELFSVDRSPEYIADVAAKIIRYATAYQRIQEHQCNGPDYDGCRTDEQYNARQRRWQAFQDTLPAKEERVAKKIHDLAAEIGCKGVHFSGDPRGCCVKLIVPSGYTDDWGREGLCVPTA